MTSHILRNWFAFPGSTSIKYRFSNLFPDSKHTHFKLVYQKLLILYICSSAVLKVVIIGTVSKTSTFTVPFHYRIFLYA